jgi:hypothetical protein
VHFWLNNPMAQMRQWHSGRTLRKSSPNREQLPTRTDLSANAPRLPTWDDTDENWLRLLSVGSLNRGRLLTVSGPQLD